MSMEEALQQVAERLAVMKTAPLQEAERRIRSPVAACSDDADGCPTDCRPHRFGASVALAVVAAHTASRTEPLDSRAFSKLDKFQSERSRWHDYISNANADMHTEMSQVEGKTTVSPNVAVINLDSVARSESLHIMLTMLVEGPALDIILNSGQGEGYELWRRPVLEYDRPRTRAAGSMMEILSHHCTADSSSFVPFDARISKHERRTLKVTDDDVKVGSVLKNMANELLRDHLELQSKRLTTYAMVRDEVVGVVQARAATGSSPMLVDALTKGKGKAQDQGKATT